MPHSSADPSRNSPAEGRRAVPPSQALVPNGDPVLAARFAVPSVPETFVRRPRLTRRLSEGLRHPLILVNGPAGAGKTLLVADWIAATPPSGPVAWLTVEHGDNAPGVFWAYVLEALRHHGVGLPADIGSPVRAGDVDSALLTRLAAHLSRQPEPVILVLDEFERVSSTEVASGLHVLLRHASPGLRLVLISRTDPLLPLHRYRAADEIADIRGADLAFVPGETADLLRLHGLTLSADGARALTERTEGWAAGLRLCALATRQAADPEAYLREFEAGQSTIADFLLAEVLDAQPAGTQDLLLRTSILERTHPDLANALTGHQDAEQILARLQRSNAFIEPVGHSWYRHHPLFAEILRIHLRARNPGLEAELHGRAAHWLCDAGRLTEALPHAAAAGDWEFAASRFVDDLAIGRLFTGLDADRLGELFSGMTAEAAGPAPELVRAALDLARYDLDGGFRHLRRAEEQLSPETPETPETPEAPGNAQAARLSCAFLRVRAARLLGAADEAEAAAGTAERLERQVPPERMSHHPELPALLLTDLGSALLWKGRFDAARTALTSAVATSEGPTTAFPRHESLSRLALIDLLRGWPGRAEAHALEAVAEAERYGLAPSSRTGVGHLVLAAVAIDRDELPGAGTALEQAAASSAARHDPITAVGLVILRSRLLLAKGDARAALDALSAAEQTAAAATPSVWVNDRVALAASAAHLADGDPQAALEVLEERGGDGPERAVASARARLAAGHGEAALELLDSLRSDHGRGPAVVVPTLLAKAQVAAHLGDETTALRLLARALATARPDRLRRPFREAGPWLRPLLRGRPALARTHGWLPSDLVVGLPPAEPGDDPDSLPVEPLSGREREVLERVSQLMSTEEIATELFLSVNTVKTHLKSINRKLSVSHRGEAVRRARQLHLL